MRKFWQSSVDKRFSNQSLSVDALDADIVVLEQMALKARRLRNRRVWAYRLPSEILVAIFSALHDIHRPRRTTMPNIPVAGSKGSYSLGWIVITHVCVLWRETAVGTPALWADPEICQLPAQFQPDILKRSQNCPLKLDLQLVDKFMTATSLARLFDPSVCSRTKSIHLQTTDAGILRALFIHALCFTQLSRLTLAVSMGGEGYELPPQICALAQFEELSLTHILVPWNSAIFSRSLTSLFFRLPNNAPQPTYAQFRAILHQMTSLRSLTLRNVVPSDFSGDLLHMPRGLSRFSFASFLDDNAAAVAHLLALLVLPSSCSRSSFLRLPREVDLSTAMANELVASCLHTFTLLDEDRLCGPSEIYYAHNRFMAFQSQQPLSVLRPLVDHMAFPHATLQMYSCLEVDRIDLGVHLPLLHLDGVRKIIFYDLAREANISFLFTQFALLAPQMHFCACHIRESLPLLLALTELTEDESAFSLFPQLETLVLYSKSYAVYLGDKEGAYATELSALSALVRLRTTRGSPPLGKIIVSKQVGSWNFWDTLKPHVDIELL